MSLTLVSNTTRHLEPLRSITAPHAIVPIVLRYLGLAGHRPTDAWAIEAGLNSAFTEALITPLETCHNPENMPYEVTVILSESAEEQLSLNTFGVPESPSFGSFYELDHGNHLAIRHSFSLLGIHISELERRVYPAGPFPLASRSFFAHPLIYRSVLEYHLAFPSFPFYCVTTLGSLLGNGSFGSVYEARIQGELRAIKFDKLVDCSSTMNPIERGFLQLKRSLEQIKMLAQIPPHPHVARFFGLAYVSSNRSFGLIFEKVNGVTLDCWNHTSLPCSQIAGVLRGLSSGLQHLEIHGWPHEDPHGKNFMVRLPQQEAIVIDYEAPHYTYVQPEPLRVSDVAVLTAHDYLVGLFTNLIPTHRDLFPDVPGVAESFAMLCWNNLIHHFTRIATRGLTAV